MSGSASINVSIAATYAENIIGGSVLVALVYWVIYLRGRRSPSG